MGSYWKITLAYLIFGVVWIFTTDHLVLAFTRNPDAVASISVAKGWFYVGLSAALIFFLTRRAFRLQAAAEAEKLRIYHRTVKGSHHILLNYLHQMQLVTMEAEKAAGFDREILYLSKLISRQATDELNRLGDLEKVTPGGVATAVFRAPTGS